MTSGFEIGKEVKERDECRKEEKECEQVRNAEIERGTKGVSEVVRKMKKKS